MMIPIETIFLYIAAVVALGLAPGPDNIFVLTQSALYGRIAGLFVTFGLCTGLLVHTTAVALGVAVIFQTSVFAFTVLKMVGALYLIYLAYKAFHATASEIRAEKKGANSLRGFYLRGVVMNITNPKIAIFFLAFLPQFVDPTVGPITTQIFFFGAISIINTMVIFGSVAWTAGFVSDWLKRSDRAQKIMNRVAGTVFAALALKLVSAER